MPDNLKSPWVVSVKVPPRFPVEFDKYYSYEFSEIQIVAGGSAIHHMGGRKHLLHEDDVLLMHPGMQNYFSDASEDFALYRISYNSNIIPSLLLDEPQTLFRHLYPLGDSSYDPLLPVTEIPDYDHTLYLNLVLRLYYEAKYNRIGGHIMVSVMFIELLTYLARSYNQEAERDISLRLQSSVMYLTRHYAQPLDLEKLAKLAGMSKRNLFRHFKLNFSMSPHQYLQKIRIQNVLRLAEQSCLSREEIALQCGFCDGNHLSKVFRRIMGHSFSQLRKK